MEIVITDKKIKECPFCKKPGYVFKEQLWNGSHGYHGCYDYYTGCLNQDCRIKPKTRGVDDIYRSSDEAIDMVINDWNERKE